VTPEHRRYDVVELPWSLVRSAVAQHLELTEEILEQVVSHASSRMTTGSH
jgi:SET domain-containing protein 6